MTQWAEEKDFISKALRTTLYQFSQLGRLANA
jgi:hypothetical protein